MTQCVIERLEIVQIDKEQSTVVRMAVAGGQGLLHAVQQQATVGQLGQRIVERQLMNRFAASLEFGDVGRYPAQGVNGAIRIAQRQFHRKIGIAGLAIGAGIVFFVRNTLAIPQHTQIVVAQILCGYRVKELGILPPDHLGQGSLEQLAHLVVGILVAKIEVLDVDIGFDAVQNDVQLGFTGMQVARLLGHLAAQQRCKAYGHCQQCHKRAQSPPESDRDHGARRITSPALQYPEIR